MSAAYIERPAVDGAVSQLLGRGSGAFALEGPAGAGKSAALLHALLQERERRGKSGRGYVRLLQLWGDEPPSLFVRRMVREVGFLHLVAYPEPERLLKLVADMAQAIPGLGGAGKLLGSLVPDDLRPLHVMAAQALSEAGQRSLNAGGPLLLGVDLLGGEVSAPVREFFTRLCERLDPTVTLLIAQPGGQASLVALPPGQRVAVGPLNPEEAESYLLRALKVAGPLDAASSSLLRSGAISLLPGDLAQIVGSFPLLGHDPRAGLGAVAEHLKRDVAARYQAVFEAALQQPSGDARALELCALVAVSARPLEPLTVELARARMTGGSLLRPTELAQLRQHPLVRALCATVATVQLGAAAGESGGVRTTLTAGGSGAVPLRPAHVAFDVGFPLLSSSAQAQSGVLQALLRHGLLDTYQDRWLQELLQTLRQGGGRQGLLAGVTALSLLIERAAREPATLGQAVTLLGELETLLWRAGWHRAFAELYDALLPHLWRAGVTPRDVAPRLWFRRARARVQGVDWASQASLGESTEAAAAPAPSALLLTMREELPLAIEELGELFELSEAAVIQARTRLALPVDGEEVTAWCRHLPYKARQGRGYGRALRLLLAGPGETRGEASRQAAIDDVLTALGHFIAVGHGEDVAQTLTILGDCYSARLDAEADRLAQHHYAQAAAVAEGLTPRPAFCLGIIHRSWGNHHRRRGRAEAAAQRYAEARRFLLRSPDARMGTLLAGLLS